MIGFRCQEMRFLLWYHRMWILNRVDKIILKAKRASSPPSNHSDIREKRLEVNFSYLTYRVRWICGDSAGGSSRTPYMFSPASNAVWHRFSRQAACTIIPLKRTIRHTHTVWLCKSMVPVEKKKHFPLTASKDTSHNLFFLKKNLNFCFTTIPSRMVKRNLITSGQVEGEGK